MVQMITNNMIMKRIFLILNLLLLLTSCKAQPNFFWSHNKIKIVQIGDTLQGGIVGYILQPTDTGYDPSTTKGLIARPDPYGANTNVWKETGDPYTTGATATAIGTGQSNTNTIISVQGAPTIGYAADQCNTLVDVYSDWYLPSKNELWVILGNIRSQLYSTPHFFWTSSETGLFAYSIFSDPASPPNLLLVDSKIMQRRIIAVRTFSIPHPAIIDNTVTLTSASGTDNQTITDGDALTTITYTTTGATGVTFSGFPTGLTKTFSSNTISISGTPTQTGTFNYTAELTGGSGYVTAIGTILINPTDYIYVDNNWFTLDNTAQTIYVHITSNQIGMSYLVSEPTWSSVSGDGTDNNVTLTINIDANTGGARTGFVGITYGGGPELDIRIDQNP
jgi:hypothetical protein